jgi:Protein of unknown function (DUF2752)
VTTAPVRAPAGLVLTGSAGVVALGACASALGAGEAEGPTLCPFRLATGLPCPFCGTTRSLMALGQGDVEASFQLNPLGLVLSAAALAVAATVLRRRPLRWPPWLVPAGGAVIAVIWIFQLVTRGAT